MRLVDHPVLDRVHRDTPGSMPGGTLRTITPRSSSKSLTMRSATTISSFDLSTPEALIQKRVSSFLADRLPYESPPTSTGA